MNRSEYVYWVLYHQQKDIMKKILILAVAICSMSLLWCAQNSAPGEENAMETQQLVYQNTEHHFSLNYPANRTLQENVYGAVARFTSPTDDDDAITENVSITVYPLETSPTPAEYYDMTKAELSKIMSDFAEVSNDPLQIGGIDAQKVVYQGTQWSTKLQMEQVYLIFGNTAYVISYAATQKTFDDFSDEANTMIASFEIQ